MHWHCQACKRTDLLSVVRAHHHFPLSPTSTGWRFELVRSCVVWVARQLFERGSRGDARQTRKAQGLARAVTSRSCARWWCRGTGNDVSPMPLASSALLSALRFYRHAVIIQLVHSDIKSLPCLVLYAHIGLQARCVPLVVDLQRTVRCTRERQHETFEAAARFVLALRQHAQRDGEQAPDSSFDQLRGSTGLRGRELGCP